MLITVGILAIYLLVGLKFKPYDDGLSLKGIMFHIAWLPLFLILMLLLFIENNK